MSGAAPAGPGPVWQDRLAYLLAIWFGCGLVPRMPGTVGTLGALPLYFALVRWGPADAWVGVGAAAVLLILVAVVVSDRVARRLGAKDPQIICIDEVAGVLVALTAAPYSWPGVIAAVVLFRIFDMTKPWPARALERLPGGWGVVLDDVAAGLWAALLIAGARAFALL